MDHSQFTIGWLCALPVEQVAAQEMLDEEYDPPASVSDRDENVYILGRIHRHHVVIILMPQGEYGKSSAAVAARDMIHTFPNVRLGLMVGVGGGVPLRHDIRLGDVVVSAPAAGTSGVLQYDFGKSVQQRSFQLTAQLDKPPRALRNAVAALQAKHLRRGHDLDERVRYILEQNSGLTDTFGRPAEATDYLFKSEVVHTNVCLASHCALDDLERLQARPPRSLRKRDPVIHYGLIGSADSVMKDALVRDSLAKEHDILCFEMEAAGMMNHFPCLIVRGVCDYADSHKTDLWQGYAAVTAAAYAKELLSFVIPAQVETASKINTVIEKTVTAGLGLVQVDVNQMRKMMERDSFLRWLSPPDPLYNYNNALKTRHPGSGQWLLQDSRYQSWKAAPRSALWLFGIPGCGKTVLSSSVIEQLRQQGLSILFFYFDFNDVGKRSLDSAICSLVVQLYEQNTDAQQVGQTLWHDFQQGDKQPSTEDLCELFLAMLRASGNIYLVLDALDECPRYGSLESRRQLLDWIGNIIEAELQSLHLILTSRPEQDIVESLQTVINTDQRIELKPELVSADIGVYIKYHVREDERLSLWRDSEDIQNAIESTLATKANGMFRWVALQIQEIQTCWTERQVRDALASLPSTLNETYGRMLERLPIRSQPDAIRLLQFLVHSERPLRVAEAIDAIAIEFQPEPRYAVDRRYRKAEHLLSICPGFVSITARASDDKPDPGPLIQLSHFSVKEYFVSSEVRSDVAKEFTKRSCRTVIVKACMVYLLHIYKNGKADKANEDAFRQYCIRYWATDIQYADSDSQTQKLAIEFYLGEDRAFKEAIQEYRPDIPSNCVGEQDGSALYYAAFNGQYRTCKELLDRGQEVNAQGGFFGNALQAAAVKGRRRTAELLLENGAEANAKGGHFGTALQAASFRNHRKSVRLLLDRGADVNLQRDDGCTAIRSAAGKGNEDIIRLLLERGADPEIRDNWGRTAMLRAVDCNHSATVKLLIEKGASYTSKDDFGKGILHRAAMHGLYTLIRMLLTNYKGLDINAQGDGGETPLHEAAERGYLKATRALLEFGARPDLSNKENMTPERIALNKGHKFVAKAMREAREKSLDRIPYQDAAPAADRKVKTVSDSGVPDATSGSSEV